MNVDIISKHTTVEAQVLQYNTTVKFGYNDKIELRRLYEFEMSLITNGLSTVMTELKLGHNRLYRENVTFLATIRYRIPVITN